MKARTRTARIAVTRPNWSAPYQVEYAFKTGVFTSRNGVEQREAYRQTARVSLQFTSALDQAMLIRHQGDLMRSMTEPLFVRAEETGVALATNVGSGASVVTVSSATAWMAAGAKIIITTADTEALYEIASRVGTTITLTTPLIFTVTTQARLHLALACRPADNAEFRAETSTVWTSNVRYDAEPGGAAQPFASASGSLFEGREVFRTKPNWTEQPRVSLMQARDTFDPGFGRIAVSEPHLSGHQNLQLGFTGLTRAESKALVDFFLRQKGKRGAFWMPSPILDIVATDTVLPGANQFEVADQEFKLAYAGHPVFNVVQATWPSGATQINRIASMAGVAEVDVTFEDNWDQAVNSGTRLRWVPLWRFDSDTLDVRWLTDSVAEVQFNLKTLYNTGF